MKDLDARAAKLSYDGNGHLARATDASARVLMLNYNDNDLLESIE